MLFLFFLFLIQLEQLMLNIHYTIRLGFLYHMVRIMAGTLIDVMQGRKTPSDVRAIIEGRDRHRAGSTAPASGLYLRHVSYEEYAEKKGEIR